MKSKILAHDAFERGREAFRKGQYHRAAEAFGESYRNQADSAVLYDKALALEKAGDFKGAVRMYQEFLRAAAAPDEIVKDVKARIDKLNHASGR